MPGIVSTFYYLALTLLTPVALSPNEARAVGVELGESTAPYLFTNGFCPDGVTRVLVLGVEPFAPIALIASPQTGTTTLASGPCAGTQLELASVLPIGVFSADASGVLDLELATPAAACGVSLEALDTTTCLTGERATVPANTVYRDLRIITRTGPDEFDGSDSLFELCISENECFAIDEYTGYDDREPSVTEETQITLETPLVLDDIERISLRPQAGSGSDAWRPTCLAVLLDGDLLYCTDGQRELGDEAIGSDPGDRFEWVDTDPYFRGCESCYSTTLSHGPLIGHTTASSAKVMTRTAYELPVRMLYGEQPDLSDAVATAWTVPRFADDFTTHFELDELAPDTDYYYQTRVRGRDSGPSGVYFTSAPAGPAAFTAAVGSCSQATDKEFTDLPVFFDLLGQEPDLMIMAGDNHYANSQETNTLNLFYRFTFGVPSLAEVLSRTPTVATWDDHDFIGDNSDNCDLDPDCEKDNALDAFARYWANPYYGSDGAKGVWSMFSWGGVDFFLLDDRYYRDPACLDVETEDADRTLLGETQREWLLSELSRSNATFKVLVSGSQFTEAGGSTDSWACFSAERDLILDQVMHAGIDGVFLLSGDVHRQEVWFEPATAGRYELWEFSSSAFGQQNFGCPSDEEPLFCSDTLETYSLLRFDTTASPPLVTYEAFDKDGALLLDVKTGAPITTTVTLDQVCEFCAANSPRDQEWHQDRYGIEGGSELGDLFGSAVAVGDFDDDGYDDLAIGVPHEDLASNTILATGALQVLYGSAGRLSDRDQFWDQNDFAVSDGNETDDHFASALAAGDFNGDGVSDLAIGVPDEDLDGSLDSGAVLVLYGDAGEGLLNDGSEQFIDAASLGDFNETEGFFGHAVETGDFNDDGFDDLAIGAPGKTVIGLSSAGSVFVIYGSDVEGLDVSQSQRWDQELTTVNSNPEIDDRFGWSLAVGDLDGDGSDDLAIGVPFEAIGTVREAGLVEVLYGGEGPLSDGGGLADDARSQSWHQESEGVGGELGVEDHWGWALEVGAFDGSGVTADLAVGVPGDEVDGDDGSGSVSVLYGSQESGLSTAGLQTWHQDTAGVRGGAEPDDLMGYSLGAADIDGDGIDDLAIGVPGEDLVDNTVVAAGAVQIFFGSDTFGLQVDAPNDEFWSQSDDLIRGQSEADDELGRALGAGDFDGDGFADLAVGTPYKDVGGDADAGAIVLIYGPAQSEN